MLVETFFVKMWIDPNDATRPISFLFYVLFICIIYTNVFVTTFSSTFFVFNFESKTCLFQEFFDKRLLIDTGSFFTICGGWFD